MFLEIFTYHFFLRALLAGLILGFFLAFLGVFVVLKKISFVGDGLAHASLGGIALALLLGLAPLPLAVLFCCLLACLLFVLEKKTKLPVDSIIGVLFTSSMSLGIILISLKSGYQPELISYLFGNILLISQAELWTIFIIVLLATIFFLIFYRQFVFSAFDPNYARISGINTSFFDLFFYLILALVLVLGVKILGIILVSALLVIPAITARFLSFSFRQMIYLSIFFSLISVLIGLFASLYFDLPSGATIVLCASLIFLFTILGRRFFIKKAM